MSAVRHELVPLRSDGELLQRYATVRDPELREELVMRFLPFARKLALRYRHGEDTFEDLVQVALIGLMKAIDRFDPDRGHRFTSFAGPTISGELKRHLRDRGWAVHVPRELQERALAVRRESERLSRTLGRAPVSGELAFSLGWPEKDVLEAAQAAQTHDALSLDAPIGSSEDGSVTRGELLGSEEPGYELAERRQDLAERWQELAEIEQRVVALRVVGDLTQREIAERVGYSQMHVSRLLRRSFQRLEEPAIS